VAVPADELPAPTLELHIGFPWGRAAPHTITLPEPVGAPHH
jgi:4'-phosphopantetheinyl transferase